MAQGGNRRFAETGRPRAIAPEWDVVFDNLPGAFWSHKGLSGKCPFCHGESTSSKMRFLIRFEEGRFKGYSCFSASCNGNGSGIRGVSRLASQMGVSFTMLEIASLAGQEIGPVADPSLLRSESDAGDDAEAGPIDWPPAWVQETDDVLIKGVEYMEGRGIADATTHIDRHGLKFSEQVEIAIGGDRYVKPYPCIVAPMTGEDGEVLGWTTRRLGNSGDDPKSIAMSGRGWKTKSLFGLTGLDPTIPVTIVEGLFSSLATPNSVALGGKDVSVDQVKLLAATGAKIFIFALDPGVERRKFADAMYRLSMLAPGCAVLHVEWERYGGFHGRDPADRGLSEMTKIIRSTVLSAMHRES